MIFHDARPMPTLPIHPPCWRLVNGAAAAHPDITHGCKPLQLGQFLVLSWPWIKTHTVISQLAYLHVLTPSSFPPCSFSPFLPQRIVSLIREHCNPQFSDKRAYVGFRLTHAIRVLRARMWPPPACRGYEWRIDDARWPDPTVSYEIIFAL